MLPLACIVCLLPAGFADQSIEDAPLETQVSSYKAQAAGFWKELRDTQSKYESLQKEHSTNLVSVQTLESVVTEQQQRISSLEAELRGKQDEHSQALLKLAKAQENAQGADASAQEDVAAAKAEVDSLKQQLKEAQQATATAEKAQKAAEKEVSNLEKQLNQATKHQEKLATQVQDARAAQKAAEEKVSQAGLEASNARKLVEAAEAKAAEAGQKAQEYYHRLTTAWTPHWLDTRLEQSKAWVNGVLSGKPGSRGSAAGPLDTVVTKVKELWAALKAWLSNTTKGLHPHFKTIRRHSNKTWRNGQRRFRQVWNAPQVKNLRSKAEQLFVQVERAVARYMRNVQVLKPYSKKPYVTAITKVLLFTPVILVLLPLLASLTGGSSQPRRPQPSPPRRQRSAAQSPATSTTSKGKSTKKAEVRGQKVVVDGEAIRVP